MPVRFTISAIGDNVNLVSQADFSAADVTRMLVAYRALYGQVDTGEKDEDGNPVIRDLTDAEVWAMFAGGLAKGVIANIRSYEEAEARKALNPAPVIFTPVSA